jgi:hypothetical protein
MKAAKDSAAGFGQIHKAIWQHKWHVLGGAAIVGASSVAFGPTVVGPLMQMPQQPHGSMPLSGSALWAAKVVGGSFGKAGFLGALATAAPLFSVALALLAPSQNRGFKGILWLLTHVAMGLSASPAWFVPLVPETLPALILAGACMVGVSALVGERLSGKQASAQMLLLGSSLVLAGAPLPALLATGTAGAQAATFGALALVGGTVACLCRTMYKYFMALADYRSSKAPSHKFLSVLPEKQLNASGSSGLATDSVIPSRPKANIVNSPQAMAQVLGDKRLHDVEPNGGSLRASFVRDVEELIDYRRSQLDAR